MDAWQIRFEELICEQNGHLSPSAITDNELRKLIADQLYDKMKQCEEINWRLNVLGVGPDEDE